MPARVVLFVLAIAAAVAPGASAATLFTTDGHGTRVTVGATATATASDVRFTIGTHATTLDTCGHSVLGLTVTQNTDAAVIMNVTSATFSGCSPLSINATFLPWKLTVSGLGTPSGSRTFWSAALHGFFIDILGSGPYTGNLTTGLTASQPTLGGGPICIDFAAAGTYTGPQTNLGKVDASYCLTGASAAWSFTN